MVVRWPTSTFSEVFTKQALSIRVRRGRGEERQRQQALKKQESAKREKDLLQGRISHIEELSLEGKDPVVVATELREACHRQRLGRVPLRQDQGAQAAFGRACPIGVIELGDADDLRLALALALVKGALVPQAGGEGG